MEIKIAKEQTGHLMTDLSISRERCEELCSAVQDSIEVLHEEGHDKVTLAQVIQRAITHARNDNESVFVSTLAGEYHAQYKQFMQNSMPQSLGELLNKLRHTHMAMSN